MPNRIIKESVCMSDSVDMLTWFEEVLFYRLIVNCDDFGRYDGRPAIIKNRLFPLKDEQLEISDVAKAINSLAKAELISLYEVDGRPYLCLTTWDKHQTIRAKKSKYPSPEEGVKTSASICKQLQADASRCNQLQANVPVIQSNPIQSESECESRAKPKRFAAPTLEEVMDYCRERGNTVDPQRFIDYYSSNGWMVGKNHMKDWKAAVRTWERSETAPKAAQKKKQYTTAAEYTQPPKIDMSLLEKIKGAGLA